MAENKESLIFQYDSNNHLSDIDDITEEKIVQKKLLEIMYMFQQYYGIIEQQKYALRSSVLQCHYGTKYTQLDCVRDHGILKKEYPVMTTQDYLKENVHSFGSCLCPEEFYEGKLPMTREADADGNVAEKAECNKFAHICVPLVGNGHGWKQVDKDVVAEVTGKLYSPLLVDKAVLICQYGGIISFKEVPEVEEEPKETGSRISYLSVPFVRWLFRAEGNDPYIYHPFKVSADEDDAKKVKTVTVGHGITFDSVGTHREIVQSCFGWDDAQINEIIEYLHANEKRTFYDQYTIDEEQDREAFYRLLPEYFKLVNDAIGEYEDKNGKKYYTQNQLEAMFDFAYNAGLSKDDIKQDDKIIKYYLEDDLPGARQAVKTYGTSRNRRRVNQMHLFFCGGYDFYDDGQKEEFKKLRNDLGLFD